ncbi:hypothetical protein [Streptomyces sp. TS71-3]|uniref:hypothetical protein n=1 Tax=Streptomyces sp. TS71-3 TaxID=2733862 RepID=UPI001B226D6A|nr:hypothetical protein [Streptomyces sp. TS71-3]GHJ38381.1 hypothetical protein Sm713_39900 [Streptomyces sp. TS71-3]
MTGSGESVTTAGGAPFGPVTADDLDMAVRLAVEALGEARGSDFHGTARSLEWDRWETVEHIGDACFYYAVQLGSEALSLSGPLPFDWHTLRPDGPHNIIFADRTAGTEGLQGVLQACAALLISTLRTTPEEKRAYHVYGLSDPEGFAAMGVVETLVHMYDVTEGLMVPWTPPAELCARVLHRLFPQVPAGIAEPWPALLWASGRIALPDRARQSDWRWYSAPAAERAADGTAAAGGADGTTDTSTA